MPYLVTNKILFLSESSKILSSTLDYNVTLAIIARLLVMNVADFCIIDVFDGRRTKRLAVNVFDKSLQPIANRMFEFTPNPRNKDAIYDTAKLGTTTIIKKATKSWINSVSKIEEEREIIKKLGLNSHLFVPLKSRGETIGVLTLASMDKKFVYTDDDAALIEELANRAGTAVDKARLYSDAQEALRTRDEFLSVASHELKTPLTSILLNLQGMLKKIERTQSQDPEILQIKKMIEVSRSQSHRMARLINDLLNVSVVSTGRLKIETEKVNLADLVRDVLTHFKTQLRNNKINVVVDLEADIVGLWDKIRLEQVLANIISNAIKYGNKKPILVVVKKHKTNASIMIKDSGIGIKKADQGMIFERFKRAVTAKDYSGLGVGLYISHQIIEAHNGKLSVESEENKGSTFCIELPLVI